MAEYVKGRIPAAETVNVRYLFRLREPVSALTHFAGFLAAVAAMPLLLIRGAGAGAGSRTLFGLSVFMMSMILLYGASSAYHSFDISDCGNRRLKKIDHMMIYVLIAGSYTPICMSGLGEVTGRRLLILVWILAAAGILMNAFWISCPKWFSSLIYIAMGWTCIPAFPEIIRSLSSGAFGWLLAGGILYTAGGIIYAVKLPLPFIKSDSFGSHEIFHLFVLAGSICHFMVMYRYLAFMG